MSTFLADLVLIVHLAFVVFVLLGGLLVLRWRWIAWLHLPAVVWGVFVELSGWICPLTPLENWLRTQGGEAAYAEDFIGRLLLAVLYPDALTHSLQVTLGMLALVVNLLVYGWLLRAHRNS